MLANVVDPRSWIRKDGLSRRRGSARLCCERSETEERIPPSPPRKTRVNN